MLLKLLNLCCYFFPTLVLFFAVYSVNEKLVNIHGERECINLNFSCLIFLFWKRVYFVIWKIINMKWVWRSEHAALVGWDHILNVDVCILSTVLFENLQSFLDQVRKIFVLSLSVINFITDIYYIIHSYTSLILEHIEGWENLPVVWDQSFSDHLRC